MSIPKISGRQARELLDGSTPGPWTATEDHIIRLGREKRGRQSPWDDDDPDPWMADESDHVLMNPEPEWKPLTENRADMLLAAAAPVLAETVTWLYERIREIHNDQRCWADAYRAPIEWDPEGKDPARLARAEAHDDCADMLATLLDDEEARP